MNEQLMSEFLPAFRGKCENRKCSNAGGQRVLSVRELRRTYPATSELPYTPLPPQATHVCDRCGMVYASHEQGFEGRDSTPPDGSIDVEIADIDWEPDRVYDTDLRSAAIELVESAGEEYDSGQLTKAIERWIPGFGSTEAEDAIEAAEVDVSAHSLADYM